MKRVVPKTSVGKAALALVLIAASFNLLVAGVDSVAGAPGGPRGSSFSTGRDGLNAFAELLETQGFEVDVTRQPLDSLDLPGTTTAIVLDPAGISDEETDVLQSFVAGGGRLIAGGEDPIWVDRLMTDAPSWAPFQVARSQPLLPVPEVAGVSLIVSEGFGSWVGAGAALPIAGDGERAIAAVARIGEGTVVLLADTAPIQNRLLDEADNAAFAIALTGPPARPVVFIESVHGYGHSTGLAALPPRWKISGLLLALATAFLIASHIRRLGYPESQGRDLAPPRRAYVDSLAATLARTRPADKAVEGMKREGRRLLSVRTGTAMDAPAEEFVQVATGIGIPAAEARALIGPVKDETDLVLAGRGLARLGQIKGEDGRR